MDIEISAQHDQAIAALYDVRARMTGLTRAERLIIEMAIMMLEYMDEYAADAPASEASRWSPEARDELMKRVSAVGRQSRIKWTVDDFDQLICSNGFELDGGSLTPRF